MVEAIILGIEFEGFRLMGVMGNFFRLFMEIFIVGSWYLECIYAF